jgi:hypothetical protein
MELFDHGQQMGQTMWHKYHHSNKNRRWSLFLPYHRYYRNYYQTSSRYFAGFVPSFAVKNRRRQQQTGSHTNKKQQQQQQQQPMAFTIPSTLDDDTNNKNNNKFRPMSLLEHLSRDTGWADWLLQRKTGSLGVSSSYPSSDKPYFSCSAALSLSGFYFRPDTITRTATKTSEQDGDTTVLPIPEQQQQGNVTDLSSLSSSETESEDDLSSPPPPFKKKQQPNKFRS